VARRIGDAERAHGEATEQQMHVLAAANTALQGRVDTLQSKVDSLSATNAALQFKVDGLAADNAALRAEMGELCDAVHVLNGRLESLEEEKAAQQAKQKQLATMLVREAVAALQNGSRQKSVRGRGRVADGSCTTSPYTTPL